MVDQLLNSALDEPFGDLALPSLLFPRQLNAKPKWLCQGMVLTNCLVDTVNIRENLQCARQRLPHSLRYLLRTITNNLSHSHTNKLTDSFRQLQRFIMVLSVTSITVTRMDGGCLICTRYSAGARPKQT